MEQELKAVLVEYIGDSGNWEWFSVTRNCTESQALVDYASQMGIENPFAERENQTGMWYLNGDDARAYEITIEWYNPK